MPVGGHTAVAFVCTVANARPSLPARMYTTPTPSATATRTARLCMTSRRLRAGTALHRVRLPALQPTLVQHGRVHAAHRPTAAQHERDLLAHAPQPYGIEARRGRR